MTEYTSKEHATNKWKTQGAHKNKQIACLTDELPLHVEPFKRERPNVIFTKKRVEKNPLWRDLRL
jgi:hypothetical protein